MLLFQISPNLGVITQKRSHGSPPSLDDREASKKSLPPSDGVSTVVQPLRRSSKNGKCGRYYALLPPVVAGP